MKVELIIPIDSLQGKLRQDLPQFHSDGSSGYLRAVTRSRKRTRARIQCGENGRREYLLQRQQKLFDEDT
ncbi:MAG: hypothetical protein IJS57_02195 [Paludibacteraceae bacterium]|nr:hypothetical protein [Paludibacteraceae bacterium]